MIEMFRAWDREDKRMFRPTMLDFHHGTHDDHPIGAWHQRSQASDDGEWKYNIDVMRATGKRDKNGVMIFEDDIVTIIRGFKEDPIKLNVRIRWDEDTCGFYLENMAIDNSECMGFMDEVGANPEVIGNIYESTINEVLK